MLSIDVVAELQFQLRHLDNSVIYILGEGSNTVFLEDYEGTVIKPAFMGINFEHTDTHYLLKVGASENWHQLVLWCMQHQIYGLENLALIPGTVGASPIQNIGAYGVEVKKYIQHVEYYDLNDHNHKVLDTQGCEFAYRDSVFKKRLADQVLITTVIFAIPKVWRPVVYYGELQALSEPSAMDIFNKVVEVRQRKLPDPAEIGNAGSFFKNPVITIKHFIHLQKTWPSIPSYPVDTIKVKVPAGWLIEQLGFKGTKIGGIGCHPNQALVLTNDGSGTGEQLLKLARAIKGAVLCEFSIVLENEVRLIGKNGPVIL
ncbi:UDP-N-acetylenolpyruvoylglucosamine reductase [Paraglaciecola psychrophila 170]|uniref:UDP-N-acetylenolpyruvoylglucosamine reductase n=2 Tax=Paraglaciecola TaxID=1621534 RepID=K7AXR5_9ALTE|nr:UDP-N-acetylenolpyruvoylglucosamine reductase [Paraglaciecola psychrophila 170]GAC39905.1 UDP-N-acetylmuramate dehydrogenase [Paraglaciecola psychrophila 170]